MNTRVASTTASRSTNVFKPLLLSFLMLATAAALFVGLPDTLTSLFDPVQRERNAFLKLEVQPIVKKFQSQDEKDLQRVMMQAEGLFAGYRAGVAGFADDLTSLGSRFGMTGRWFGEVYDKYWNGEKKPTRISRHVEQSFHQHVVSPGRMEQDIRVLITEFLYSLEANQNLMLSEIRQAVLGSELYLDIDAFESDSFRQMLIQHSGSFRTMGASSTHLLAVDVLTGLATGRLAIYLARGAMGGKIGLAISAIIAVTVDIVSTQQVKAELRAHSVRILDEMMQSVLYDKKTGLEVTLSIALKEMHELRGTVIAETIRQ